MSARARPDRRAGRLAPFVLCAFFVNMCLYKALISMAFNIISLGNLNSMVFLAMARNLIPCGMCECIFVKITCVTVRLVHGSRVHVRKTGAALNFLYGTEQKQCSFDVAIVQSFLLHQASHRKVAGADTISSFRFTQYTTFGFTTTLYHSLQLSSPVALYTSVTIGLIDLEDFTSIQWEFQPRTLRIISLCLEKLGNRGRMRPTPRSAT